MPLSPNSTIAIAGAGSVGCYIGGRLILAGRNVRFLLRPSLQDALARNGMRLGDLNTPDALVPADALDLTNQAEKAFAQADVILVTVKSGATAAMADLIYKHTSNETIIVSLQNGVDNVNILREKLGYNWTVIGGIVPFNIVQTRTADEPVSFRRTTSGTMLIAAGDPALRDLLNVPGAPFEATPDLVAQQWAKLLLNLNNGLNALSGLPLAAEFADRAWRRLLALQMEEGLAALKAAAIRPAPIFGIPPGLLAKALRLPDWLFSRLARRMLSVDPRARSSMWDDLKAGKPTEIADMQGAIIALGQRHGVPTPWNERIFELVKQAETAGQGSPCLSPQAIAGPGPSS